MTTTDYIGFPHYNNTYWNEVAELMFNCAEVDDNIDAAHAQNMVHSDYCDENCIDLHAERREIVNRVIDMGLTVHDINLQVALLRHANKSNENPHNNSTHHQCTSCGKEL